MPNLRQLEYLVAVAETLNFRRAAQRVHTTQPTLSEQIKALEDRLAVKLLERSSSRVVVTAIGQEITEIARRMLRDASEIRTLAARRSKELSGLLRVGLPHTIGPYLMRRAAPELRQRYPNLKLYVREELPQALPYHLQDGTLDVAVGPFPVTGPDLEYASLGAEPLLLAIGTAHRFASQRQLKFAELKGETVLTLAHGHLLHEDLASDCEAAGAILRCGYEGTSLDMLKEMIALGQGVTFMPGIYAQTQLKDDATIHLVPITDRRLERPIRVAWRASSPDKARYEELAQVLKRSIDELC